MPNNADNATLHAKLDLRRYFLKKYHADGSARVMDCSSGDGRLWTQLRREFVLSSYWGFTAKPKAGHVNLRIEQILGQSGWSENVIDINDGRPWEKWAVMLPNVTGQATVFLTLGHGGRRPIRISGEDLLNIGLTASMAQKLSGALTRQLLQPIISHRLGQAIAAGLRIIEAREADCGHNIRCLGLRLERKSTP